MRSQGNAWRRVTLTAGHTTSLNPSLSGDGRRLFFESNAGLTGDGEVARFRAFAADVSAEPTAFTHIADARAPAPALSQDGASAAFASAEDPAGGNADRNSEIFFYSAGRLAQITDTTPASPPTRLLDGNFQPSISDDGRLITFASNRNLTGGNSDANLEVFIYDAASHLLSQVTNTAGIVGTSDAKISGDGSRVAFVRDNSPAGSPSNSKRDLILFDRAAGSFDTLAEGIERLALPPGRAISDDGLRVVYSAETATNASQVFLYDGRNGTVRQITRLGSRASDVPLNPTLSGDGSRLTFATRRTVTGGNADASVELYLYDLPTDKFSRITDAPAGATAEVVASLNDEGSLVAFNFPRTLAGAISEIEFANTSEIFLSRLSARAPFSTGLKLRYATTPNRDLSPAQAIAPGQIAIARGENFALSAVQTTRLPDGSFPRAFRNTIVTVNGLPSQLLFVSPTQINFQIPDGVAPGAAAQIVVRNHDGYESRTAAPVARSAPGVFTEGGDGTGAAIALDSRTQLRAPFDPHDGANDSRRVTICATGVRYAAALSVSVANRLVTVEAVIPSPDLPGLDEIHLALPRSLAGAGVVPLSINSDGVKSNETSIELIGARRPSRIVLIPSASTFGIGRALRFAATVYDADGELIANVPVNFSSDNTNVATIDSEGRASALRVGSTKIRARAGEASVEAELRVRPLTLAINEVLADPSDGLAGDANRDGVRSASQDEFVEIVNASEVDLDLGDYRVATRDGNSVLTTRHTFAPGTILPPGAAAVVFGGANAATFNPRDPSFADAYVATASTGSLSLLNGGSIVALLDPLGATVEELSYGGETALEGDRNASLTRSPDILGDFVLHQTPPEAAGRLFSPGAKLDGAPFRTTAPVSRIEIDPADATAQAGASQSFVARALDSAGRELGGVIFRWQSSDANVATVEQNGVARTVRQGLTQITATARGIRSASALLTVAPPPKRVFRVEVSPPASFINRGESVQLVARAYDQGGHPVAGAIFIWGADGSDIVKINAEGLARGGGVGMATITATTDDGAGGAVTGRATLDVKVPITITEILADVPPDDPATSNVEGDSNRDGVRNSDDDEFVELFNPSAASVDLSGVIVSDAAADRFTFPPNTFLEAGRALVIFGGGSPPPNDPAFGGSRILKASSLSLNDGGDTLSLKLRIGGADTTLASQSYGTAGGMSAPDDQSLTRERNADGSGGGLGNDFVAHLAAENSAGRAFSPGTLPDGSPFGSARITRIEILPSAVALDINVTQNFTARAFTLEGASEVELLHVSFAWDASAPARLSLTPVSGASTTASAFAPGSSTVRARAGGQQALAFVKVNPPPPVLTRVVLSPLAASTAVGAAQHFTARALDQFDHPYPSARLSFASTDASVATIDSVLFDVGNASATATITGRREGVARVTATASDGMRSVTSAEATLQVFTPPPVVKRVVVSPSDATVNRGQSRQFNARAFDQNDREVTGVAFTWSTTNTGIATVSASGLARGSGVGATNVVATTPNGEGRTISGQAVLTVRAPLVINEILADVPPDVTGTSNIEGDANRDGVRNSDDDEFIELLNNSDSPLDLSGVVVADSTSNRYTFPAGTMLAAGRAAIVFGGGSPLPNDPAFGGALVFTAGSLALNDGGDSVTIKLSTGGTDTIIAAQSYGTAAQGAPPAPSDQSLTRAPDAEAGGAGGGFVAHGGVASAAGRIFSPGTRSDGTPFGSPPLTRVEITPASARLDIGARQAFNARAFALAGGAEVEVAHVSFVWDADAAKVSLTMATGAGTTATALAAGSASVRAKAGGLQTSAPLTVNPPPPVLTRVELTPNAPVIVVGQTQEFRARAFDQFDQPYAGATYAFNTDDASVARLESATVGDASAVATFSGRSAGAAHVFAKANSGATSVASNVATLTVNPPPRVLTRITVSPASATVAAGESQQFTARGFDQEGQEITGLAFAWASSKQGVATIKQDGLATASNAGSTQVTAASGAVTSAPATLRVTAPPVAAPGQVIINEALVAFATPTPSPSPTPQRADFIELYNTTGQTLDISGLVVSFRASGNSSAASTVALPGAVGSLTTLIQPHGYFLIVNGATTFGVSADLDANRSGFDLNNSSGAIKIELNGAKLDGLRYQQNGSAIPPAAFNNFGEESIFAFAGGATNDLIRNPNAADTNNNSTDFKRNSTTASVTPKAINPIIP